MGGVRGVLLHPSIKRMMKTLFLPKPLIQFCLAAILALALAGCQSEAAKPSGQDETPASQQSNQPLQAHTKPGTSAPEPAAGSGKSDPAAIKVEWRSSPHAHTFVLDETGQNNSCARCHAPVNWSPSMAELPESCFACKFELKDPDPLVPEDVWADISCNVCHKVDKKGYVQPEYAWLEIAPLEEYTDVASPTELCLKCHAPVDLPDHASVTVRGAHAGYDCTRCHSPHSTTASCAASGCHDDAAIPGHDAFHQQVSCSACHDAGGMEVDIDVETGKWFTYLPSSAETNGGHFAFTSHNMTAEVDCSRCHFGGNSWGITESVTQP